MKRSDLCVRAFRLVRTSVPTCAYAGSLVRTFRPPKIQNFRDANSTFLQDHNLAQNATRRRPLHQCFRNHDADPHQLIPMPPEHTAGSTIDPRAHSPKTHLHPLRPRFRSPHRLASSGDPRPATHPSPSSLPKPGACFFDPPCARAREGRDAGNRSLSYASAIRFEETLPQQRCLPTLPTSASSSEAKRPSPDPTPSPKWYSVLM